MSAGAELRDARMARGLSLADVARVTRVRATLLDQIEHDDFSGCGGAVYARGHLRAFAAAVGIDAAPLIADFDAGHDSVPVPVLGEAFPTAGRNGIRERTKPNWTAYGVGAAAVLTLLLGGRYVTEGGASPSSAGQLATGPATTTASPSAPTTTTSARPVPQPTIVAQLAPVVVELKVTKAPGSWVQETEDGTTSFAQILTNGATKRFTAQKSVKLRLGNAGAVDLTVNGKHLGMPGAAGQVIDVAFGPTGTTGQG